MKLHLKLSENLLIQCKSDVFRNYNRKGLKVNLEFCIILLLNTNFQYCLILIFIPKNVFLVITFLITFFWWKVVIKSNMYTNNIASRYHTLIVSGICAVIRKLLTI